MITTLVTEIFFNIHMLELNNFNSAFKELANEIYLSHQSMQKYFNEDLNKNTFYKTRTSQNISAVKESHKKVKQLFKKVLDNKALDRKLLLTIITLKQDLARNYQKFDELTLSRLQLGFRDWGKVGSWRKEIKKLEQVSRSLKDDSLITDILMLRNNEKDYILRKDNVFFFEHQKIYKKIKNKLINHSDSKFRQLVPILDSYLEEFNSYIKLEQIYLKNLESFNVSKDHTTKEILLLLSKTTTIFQENYTTFQYIINLTIIVCSFIGLSYSLKSGRSLAKPILQMNQMLNSLNALDTNKLQSIKSTDEINLLRDSIIHFKNETEYQKTLLASQAQLSTIGEVSANISHEILNPLTIIMTNVSLLKRQIENPKKEVGADDFKGIENAVNKVTNIIQSIRKLARTEHQSEFKVFKVKDLITPIDFLLGNKLRNDNIDFLLKNRIPDKDIHGNESLLAQVVINLINNSRYAIQNLSAKWIELEITQDEYNLQIKITDSGHGIPEAIRVKLFKERVTTKSVDEGTGLGLPLCKRIIDEHQGKIWIDEKADNTTFVIQIPNANSIQQRKVA